jgi:hypothetical protein
MTSDGAKPPSATASIRGDLPDIQALAFLECEQDPLAMLVAQRGESPRDRAPLARDVNCARSGMFARHRRDTLK